VEQKPEGIKDCAGEEEKNAEKEENGNTKVATRLVNKGGERKRPDRNKREVSHIHLLWKGVGAQFEVRGKQKEWEKAAGVQKGDTEGQWKSQKKKTGGKRKGAEAKVRPIRGMLTHRKKRENGDRPWVKGKNFYESRGGEKTTGTTVTLCGRKLGKITMTKGQSERQQRGGKSAGETK